MEYFTPEKHQHTKNLNNHALKLLSPLFSRISQGQNNRPSGEIPEIAGR
jgi:hypothetical protein